MPKQEYLNERIRKSTVERLRKYERSKKVKHPSISNAIDMALDELGIK